MADIKNGFGSLFKDLRLKSGLSTLSQFGDALTKEGMVYEESLFSHWQKGDRIPKDRKLLLTILKIFLERGGIYSPKIINSFLESANQKPPTEQELGEIAKSSYHLPKLNPPFKILTFLMTTIASKTLIRTGWKRERIKNPESVAEHSFQLSIMAMIFADQFGLDKEKLIKMAILHDLGELVTGDIIWSKGKFIDLEKRKNKEAAEMRGIIRIFKIIDKTDEYKNIFEEMIERRSLEAKIFWQLDKLEMAVQALEYEKKYHKNLTEFFVNSDLQIQAPFLRKILKQVLKQRPKHTRL